MRLMLEGYQYLVSSAVRALFACRVSDHYVFGEASEAEEGPAGLRPD
jgi:hypothetical protein